MRKHLILILAVLIILLTMACSIGYEGVSIGDDPEVNLLGDQMAVTDPALTDDSPGSSNTQEPEYNSGLAQGSNAEAVNSGEHTYAVAATNFNCTCQVDGDMKVGINITGDQLEYSVFGGAPDLYNKIGDNTFQRTFMGYYILSSESDSQATETVVEEERHTVIILNNNGFVMEAYQGDAASPCCYHTFTIGSTP